MQLSLLSIGREIVSERQVMDAWQWLCSEINARPNQPNASCFYDRKLWGQDQIRSPLEPSSRHVEPIGALYLLTQFGDLTSVVKLTNEGVSAAVSVFTDKIEVSIRELISSKRRFRSALSEHLAFWVYVALQAKSRSALQFIRSRPNIKPEKQGPDGVSISIPDASLVGAIVEVHSVKNSIRSPKALLSTAKLRRNGQAQNQTKLLDEFWFTANRGDSFIELDELLESICNQLRFESEKKLRMALLMKCIYNANVVADDSFANVEVFEGYEHVVPDVNRRLATYIGSSDWQTFAEETRRWVIQTLSTAGVW